MAQPPFGQEAMRLGDAWYPSAHFRVSLSCSTEENDQKMDTDTDLKELRPGQLAVSKCIASMRSNGIWAIQSPLVQR
jgi:hypothetical protein